MAEKVKKNLGLAIRIIVPVVLIYLLFRNLDWPVIWKVLHGYPIWIFIVSILFNILSNIIFGYRWHYILQSADIDVPFPYVLSLVFYSLFFSNFLPTTIGGDLVKVTGILNRDDGDRRTLRISSVIADRIFSFASKLLLLPVTIWLFHQFLPVGFQLPWQQSAFLLNLLPKGFREKARHYFDTIQPWLKAGRIAKVLGISWWSLLITIISDWILMMGINPNVSPMQVFCVILLTYFASILPITINGIGVQESSITYLLTLIGFSYEQGLAAALLIRIVTLIVSAIGGVWMMISGKDIWHMIHSGKKEEILRDTETVEQGEGQ